MFWLTPDAVIAGRLQEVVARGRTMPPLLNPLFNVAQRPHDGGRVALGLALEGVQVGRLTVRWEWLRARTPAERRWIGVLPITALNLNPDGSSALYRNWVFRDTAIPTPRMRWRRFAELVEAIRSRQADPDERLDAPTGTMPTARPDPGRPDLLWWVDGATGELSTTPLETTPDKHWWPGARRGGATTACHGSPSATGLTPDPATSRRHGFVTAWLSNIAAVVVDRRGGATP